jgi:hypothetical protein
MEHVTFALPRCASSAAARPVCPMSSQDEIHPALLLAIGVGSSAWCATTFVAFMVHRGWLIVYAFDKGD